MIRYEQVKRCADILGACTGLVVCSPVMAAVAIAIRVDMGSPVLFKQSRPGYQERPFNVIKFRTMREAYSKNGEPLPDTERITRLGRFLRRSSLDELPQFFNILRGDMSFIGPRPLLHEYIPYYTTRERKRHLVRPGITGLAQVSGRNRLPWDERFELDVRYVEQLSFKMDVNIFIKTIHKVLSRDDVVESLDGLFLPFIVYRTNSHKKDKGSSPLHEVLE